MARKLPSFTVLKDSREQDGWDFTPEDKRPGKCRLVDTKIVGLSAGDYSVEGLEDKVLIERKNGFCELFGNYTPKENKERFYRECEKLIEVPHRYIIIETNLNKDTLGLGIPQSKFALPSRRVLDWILQIQLDYDINVMFVGDAGKKVARNIFENVLKKYGC